MKISRPLLCLLLLVSVAAFCANHPYTAVDIGAPQGFAFAQPQAINASGQITGATGPGGDSGIGDVFIYSNGSFTNLGTLGGKTGIGNAI